MSQALLQDGLSAPAQTPVDLLVVAGDNHDVDGVAPFLKPDWEELQDIPGMLDAYGVGVARYRRTKKIRYPSPTSAAMASRSPVAACVYAARSSSPASRR